jgi:hypothetical protein
MLAVLYSSRTSMRVWLLPVRRGPDEPPLAGVSLQPPDVL